MCQRVSYFWHVRKKCFGRPQEARVPTTSRFTRADMTVLGFIIFHWTLLKERLKRINKNSVNKQNLRNVWWEESKYWIRETFFIFSLQCAFLAKKSWTFIWFFRRREKSHRWETTDGSEKWSRIFCCCRNSRWKTGTAQRPLVARKRFCNQASFPKRLEVKQQKLDSLTMDQQGALCRLQKSYSY